MNTFDIVIAAILLFGFIRGLFKGLFVEVASLAAIVFGIYGAIHFSFFISDWLKKSVQWNQNAINLVSFCITFVIILILVALLGKALTKIADFASLGILNKILGGVFGILKFGIILSIAFIFFGKMNNTIPFIKQEVLNQSILYGPVKKIAPLIFPSIIKNENDTDNKNNPKDNKKSQTNKSDS